MGERCLPFRNSPGSCREPHCHLDAISKGWLKLHIYTSFPDLLGLSVAWVPSRVQWEWDCMPGFDGGLWGFGGRCYALAVPSTVHF